MSAFPPGYIRSQLLVKLPYPEKRFDGQTIIVTGSNSGMGLEGARHLVRLGAAKVILAVRSPERGRAAAESITASTKRDGVVEVWQLDLASYASVEAFAKKANTLDRLDVVIENAGILTRKFSTAEDNESTVTVNVVSTMYLALLLLPKLRETSIRLDKDVVLTFTGSFVHWLTAFPERKADSILLECASESKANMGDRYYLSKLMELFAFRALVDDLNKSTKPGRFVVSIINPGYVKTDILRESTGITALGLSLLTKVLARTTEVGGRTLVHAAEGLRETHGAYLDDCKVGQVSPFVRSDDGVASQQKLWRELTDKFENLHPGIMQNI